MFYESRPDQGKLFQGDIIEKFPVVTLPEDIKIVRFKERFEDYSEATVHRIDKLDVAFNAGTEAILVQASLMDIMVISQTCDIYHRDFVTIAPIFPLSNVDKKSQQKAIIDRKTFYRFYLPLINNFPESYLDITTINSVKLENLKIDNRILSLSDFGRSHLTYFINNYFNRPFQMG